LLPVDPAQDLALGDACLSIAMVAMQGDTAIAGGRAGKERVGALRHAHLLGIAPALRRPQDLDRAGREALIGEPALMRRRLRGVEEVLMALCQVARGACQRKLLVLEPPLTIAMGLKPVQRTFPLRTHARLMIDLEPPADGFKRVRRLGAATI
jgi:hypothetical protein